MTCSAGQYSYKRNRLTDEVFNKRITLSIPYHKKHNNDIIKTLVHEMVHAKYPQDKHGYKFQQEMKRLNSMHNLDITIHSKERAVTNYKYQCTNCSQSYNRSRRLDYKKYKCGRCGNELKEIKV